MNASNHQPSVTIKQWEDAGASLVAALGNYMDLCLKLTPSSLGEGINPKNVAIRIDPTVKAIFKEITEIGSTLARTRNRLVSPLLQLPEEIISIIFTHYVFDRMIPDLSRPSSLAQEVWHIHYGLDTLIHVCSSWRNFLIAKGRFWSIIPVLTGSSTSEWSPLECSLQRAGGCKLYLAVDDGNWEISKLLLAVLSEHSSRFRSINLNIRDHHVIRDALIKMLQQDTTRSLTELSIRWSTALDASPSLPSDSAYILPREHPQQALFRDGPNLRLSGGPMQGRPIFCRPTTCGIPEFQYRTSGLLPRVLLGIVRQFQSTGPPHAHGGKQLAQLPVATDRSIRRLSLRH
ncbi:hypothetical protein RSAG8_08839, partial [Rhizoctonia solani AG-8 WAC10335]